MFGDLLSLFFPRSCAACGRSLYRNESLVCTYCQFHLPRTQFHTYLENPVYRQFYGKVPVQNATSLFYFSKKGAVQKLIHNLKYKGKSHIGEWAGEVLGRDLNIAPGYQGVHMILPVPLHPSKKRLRGYNQSDFFARGLSASMKIPYYTDILVRERGTSTQTRKSRFDRWLNVETVFALRSADQCINKHILIVDDVLTTGSTIAACAEKILKVPGSKVSVATIAYARL